MFNHPDFCEQVTEKLPSVKFVTSFNRRVYQSLTEKIKNNEDYSISAFNGEFSPDEVGKITSILEKYSNMGIDRQVVSEYIDLLNNFKEKQKSDEEMTDDDFLRLRNELKSKKS